VEDIKVSFHVTGGHKDSEDTKRIEKRHRDAGTERASSAKDSCRSAENIASEQKCAPYYMQLFCFFSRILLFSSAYVADENK
jgi:hypothetical protein